MCTIACNSRYKLLRIWVLSLFCCYQAAYVNCNTYFLHVSELMLHESGIYFHYALEKMRRWLLCVWPYTELDGIDSTLPWQPIVLTWPWQLIVACHAIWPLWPGLVGPVNQLSCLLLFSPFFSALLSTNQRFSIWLGSITSFPRIQKSLLAGTCS